MLKINKKVEYALMILKEMNHFLENDASFTAKDLSQKFKIPFDTTSKVLQKLNQAELVSSTQGIKGGYSLKSNLKEVSYVKLAEVVEGKKLLMSCHEQNCSLLDKCNITTPITSLNEYVFSSLKKLTVWDLVTEANLEEKARISP